MFQNGYCAFAVSAEELAEQIRAAHPRVHCYVPVVSANDTANLLLACGASPILSDNPEEAAEITRKSQALSLSLGMPSQSRWDAMLTSGATALQNGLPMVLDLTGVGVSSYRRVMAENLIRVLHPSVIKGNVSELGCLTGYGSDGSIDANVFESGCAIQNEKFLSCLKAYARKQAVILVCTGETDLVVSEQGELYEISGGSVWMSRISGTGCMLTAVLAAALGSRPEDRLQSVILTLQLFKNWGAWAARQMKANEGPGSYRMHFLDAPFCMKPAEKEEA